MAQEYEVGYRKPPKTTRFKAGKSGNPRGRPKGSTNLATDLSAELSEQITVREGGQARRVTKQRALIKSLTAQALQGDVRATTALLALYARVISEPAEAEINPIEEDELLILRRFGPRLVNTLGKKGTKIDRDLANAIYRTDFGAFTYRAFEAINPGQRLIPNWHIEVICYQLQLMVDGEARKRLVVNLPPRTLKSFIVSVALPAWLLGRAPSTR